MNDRNLSMKDIAELVAWADGRSVAYLYQACLVCARDLQVYAPRKRFTEEEFLAIQARVASLYPHRGE